METGSGERTSEKTPKKDTHEDVKRSSAERSVIKTFLHLETRLMQIPLALGLVEAGGGRRRQEELEHGVAAGGGLAGG